MKSAKGFTLIEIMIVVALISILAAIAIPAYGDYVIRGKLVDATTNLADARIKLEQFFQDYRAYDNSHGGTPPCPAASKYFTFACAATPTTYTVTAISKANEGLGVVGDYTYTIDETNAKKTTKLGGTVLTSNNACWITKKAGSC
jgi:type IV pilus assembly protein PilE